MKIEDCPRVAGDALLHGFDISDTGDNAGDPGYYLATILERELRAAKERIAELELFVAETVNRLIDPMYDDVANREGLAIDCKAVAGDEMSMRYLDVNWQTDRAIKAESERNRLAAKLAEVEKDADRWREYEKVRTQAATKDALRIDLTLNHANQTFGISAVLSTLEFGSSQLGIETIGLAAKDQAQKLFAAIDSARSKHD